MGSWNSTLQAAWHVVKHAHWACLCYVPIEIWCLWITSTIWLLILSSTSFMVGRLFARVLSLFLMRSIGRSPLGVTRRVNRTILYERVWCTTQLAKLSFNHSNGCTHSWRFSTFLHTYEIYRAFRSVFRFVSDNILDIFCSVCTCTQTAFLIEKQKALGDFQITFQMIFAPFAPDWFWSQICCLWFVCVRAPEAAGG